MSNDHRLDAAESVWFKRQLEFVDQTMNQTLFTDNSLARLYIPTQPGVPDWANTYVWHMFTKYGRAKVISNNSDDLPRADASGEEAAKVIKDLGAAYGWTLREIKRSAQTGVGLDTMKAMAARFAIDTELDSILAIGSTEHKLEGLLNITGANTYTPTTKGAGGKTWAVATADEIAGDLFGIATKAISDLKMAGGSVFSRFTILLPIAQFGLISQKRMGDGSNVSIKAYVLANSPWIEAIEPWHHCGGAGDTGSDRMVCYPRNPLVVAGIVPQEFTTMPPEQRNLEYVVNCVASTGGVVCRYPVAVLYGDGI